MSNSRRTMVAGALLVVLATSGLAGCGSSGSEGATSSGSMATTAAPDRPTTSVSPDAGFRCKTALRTLNTAVEAYYAKYGADAVNVDQMVAAGLLRSADEALGYTPNGNAPPGGRCSLVQPGADAGSSSEEAPTASSCADERRTLATAIEAYYAMYGGDPASLGTLQEAGLIAPHDTLGYTVGAGGSITGDCSD